MSRTKFHKAKRVRFFKERADDVDKDCVYYTVNKPKRCMLYLGRGNEQCVNLLLAKHRGNRQYNPNWKTGTLWVSMEKP